MKDDVPLPPGFTRESTIRVDRNGGIWHDGQPVTHQKLAEAFARWIELDEDTGRYIIRNKINWVYVAVDDTPLVVRSCTPDLELAVSDGTHEPLDRATLRLDLDEVPYCRVRGGALPARFLPAAAFSLFEALGSEAEKVPKVADPKRPI